MNIFINGFGRIGQSIYNILKNKKNINIVGINDIYPIDIKDTKTFCIKDTNKLDLNGVDILIQSNGKFITKKENEIFLKKGAKKIIISAPSDAPTFIYGINHHKYQNQKIISASSCSATAITAVIKIFFEFGIKGMFCTMIHSYTNDQILLDDPIGTKDLRKSRSATLNILPLKSSAKDAVKRFYPDIDIEAINVRVPVSSVTIYELSFFLQNPPTKDEFLKILKKLPHTKEKLVSSDFKGSYEKIIVDLDLSFLDKNLVKIVGYQDNESGYSFWLSKLLEVVHEKS